MNAPAAEHAAHKPYALSPEQCPFQPAGPALAESLEAPVSLLHPGAQEGGGSRAEAAIFSTSSTMEEKTKKKKKKII